MSQLLNIPTYEVTAFWIFAIYILCHQYEANIVTQILLYSPNTSIFCLQIHFRKDRVVVGIELKALIKKRKNNLEIIQHEQLELFIMNSLNIF